jgi:hypothetical protein
VRRNVDVKLINTDGLTLIGSGSEWFWSAVSGLILIVTFIAIYRQLRTARGATAFDQLDAFERELESERMVRNELEVLVALRAGVDPAHLPQASADGVGAFWDKIGALARRGHLDPELLFAGSGFDAVRWWVALEPNARRFRTEVMNESVWDNFEWLAGRMTELARRSGAPNAPLFDNATLFRELDARITYFRDRLRVEQALRAVILQAPDEVPTAPPSAPSRAETTSATPRRGSPPATRKARG